MADKSNNSSNFFWGLAITVFSFVILYSISQVEKGEIASTTVDPISKFLYGLGGKWLVFLFIFIVGISMIFSSLAFTESPSLDMQAKNINKKKTMTKKMKMSYPKNMEIIRNTHGGWIEKSGKIRLGEYSVIILPIEVDEEYNIEDEASIDMRNGNFYTGSKLIGNIREIIDVLVEEIQVESNKKHSIFISFELENKKTEVELCRCNSYNEATRLKNIFKDIAEIN